MGAALYILLFVGHNLSAYGLIRLASRWGWLYPFVAVAAVLLAGPFGGPAVFAAGAEEDLQVAVGLVPFVGSAIGWALLAARRNRDRADMQRRSLDASAARRVVLVETIMAWVLLAAVAASIVTLILGLHRTASLLVVLGFLGIAILAIVRAVVVHRETATNSDQL